MFSHNRPMARHMYSYFGDGTRQAKSRDSSLVLLNVKDRKYSAVSCAWGRSLPTTIGLLTLAMSMHLVSSFVDTLHRVWSCAVVVRSDGLGAVDVRPRAVLRRRRRRNVRLPAARSPPYPAIRLPPATVRLRRRTRLLFHTRLVFYSAD